MNKGILKWIVLQAVLLLGFTFFYSILQANQIISTTQSNISTDKLGNSWNGKQLSDCSNYIQIEKSNNLVYGIKIEDNPYEMTLSVRMSSVEPILLKNEDIQKGKAFFCEIAKEWVADNRHFVEILFHFQKIYEFQWHQDDNYIYIEYVEPRKIYEHILLIDPGHGGKDSGTLSYNKKIMEKDINKKVADLVREKFKGQDNVKVYVTRNKDTFVSPHDRIAFINALNPDLCVSLHCNSGENKDAKGVEILYQEGKNSEEGNYSKLFAEILGQEITGITGQNERELVPGNGIYIVKHSKVPIALVELGFLSNKEETGFLVQEKNQKKLASGIYLGIQKMLQEIKE